MRQKQEANVRQTNKLVTFTLGWFHQGGVNVSARVFLEACGWAFRQDICGALHFLPVNAGAAPSPPGDTGEPAGRRAGGPASASASGWEIICSQCLMETPLDALSKQGLCRRAATQTPWESFSSSSCWNFAHQHHKCVCPFSMQNDLCCLLMGLASCYLSIKSACCYVAGLQDCLVA